MSKPDNHKNIKDSFETEYENVSNKELVYRMKNMNSIFETDTIKLEMNRRLIDEIFEFNKNSSEQNEVIISLTKWLKWLTIAMLIAVIVQIILFFVK